MRGEEERRSGPYITLHAIKATTMSTSLTSLELCMKPASLKNFQQLYDDSVFVELPVMTVSDSAIINFGNLLQSTNRRGNLGCSNRDLAQILSLSTGQLVHSGQCDSEIGSRNVDGQNIDALRHLLRVGVGKTPTSATVG